MNRQKTIWWALSAVVVVVVSAVSASGVVTWLMQQTSPPRTRDYPAAQVKSVQLSTGSATVRVSPTTDSRARVTQTLRWVFSKPMVTERFDPNTGTLFVDASCDGLKFLGGSDCSVQLDLAVPSGAAVNWVSESGELDLSGTSGPVDAQTSSGQITLDHLSGPVNARLDAGEIKATALRSSQVTARAFSGDILLDFDTAPTSVTAVVTSGQASVALPMDTRYRVHASTVSGDTKVDPGLDSASASGIINVSVTSGDADVAYR